MIWHVCGSKLSRCKWRAAGASKERRPSPASTTRWIAKHKWLDFVGTWDWRSDPSVRWSSVSDRPITRHDSSPVNGPILFCHRCCSCVRSFPDELCCSFFCMLLCRVVFWFFFYKCDPLSNVIVKNSPLQKLLLKLAWRKVEKATRVFPPFHVAGSNLPPSQLARNPLSLNRL
jgi:hypothetical protein